MENTTMTVKELKTILEKYNDSDEIEIVVWSDGGYGCGEILIDGDIIIKVV